MNYPPTRPQPSTWQQSQQSPVADLIQRHRAEMARIWERHQAELRKPENQAA